MHAVRLFLLLRIILTYPPQVQAVRDRLEQASKQQDGTYPKLMRSGGQACGGGFSIGGQGDSFYEYLLKVGQAKCIAAELRADRGGSFYDYPPTYLPTYILT